jgi:hypothetical protein
MAAMTWQAIDLDIVMVKNSLACVNPSQNAHSMVALCVEIQGVGGSAGKVYAEAMAEVSCAYLKWLS